MQHAIQDIVRLSDTRHSQRLTLRPMGAVDAGALWEATRHPAFNQFLTWPAPTDFDSVVQRVVSLRKSMAHHQSVTLSGVHAQTGDWVGAFRFSPDAQADYARAGWLEMGLWVHPHYWADGYAGELHALCTRLVFEGTNTPGLSARVMDDNIRGIKTLQRQGLTPAGRIDIGVEGAEAAPGWLYRITRDTWRQQEAQQPEVSAVA